MAGIASKDEVPRSFIILIVVVGVILLVVVGGGLMSIFVSLWKLLFTGTLAQKIPVPLAVAAVVGVVIVMNTRRKYQPEDRF